MLKKVIVGVVCFILVAVTAAGVYLYMLDWNQHKKMVEDRFSQITGLNAKIDGNLAVELFPTPMFQANIVKFFKNGPVGDPLIVVNQVSAHVNLRAMMSKKFILSAMTLVQPTINVTVSENGEVNWSGIHSSGSNKSGNIEVSFNDIRMSDATVIYKDMKTGKETELPHITATVSAPALKGPYKTDGKLIYNNSEFHFNGHIVKENLLTMKMTMENASSGTKASIDGTLGNHSTGTFTFDTPHLLDIASIIFGEGSMPELYDNSLYLSFKYGYDDSMLKLENLNIAYGQETKGVGSATFNLAQIRKTFTANLDMTKLNLNILQNLAKDAVSYLNKHKVEEMTLANYTGDITIKSGNVLYNNAAAENLNLGLALKKDAFEVTRFGLELPGETNIKAKGQIALNDNLDYNFNQVIKTADLRTFASIFGIDLTKLASTDNKKAIFKKTDAAIKFSGNKNNLTISIPAAVIDTTELKGNIGFAKKEGELYAVADLNISKVLFDKYIDFIPTTLAKASLEKKLVHQFNLIPWDHKINVDAQVKIGAAVYNNIPLENLLISFANHEDNLTVQKLNIGNIAGASVNMNFDATNIYSEPNFKELTYDIRTTNLPKFTDTLGLNNISMPLFKRKLFAAQGAMSGNLKAFNLSSVQKFGDTEFSYTGTVANNQASPFVEGSLELKTSNFVSFAKHLNLNYSPDMPVTTFTLAGKLKGTNKLFELKDIHAYLGANAIDGQLQADLTGNKPQIIAQLDFDKFDVDHWFNPNNYDLVLPNTNASAHSFIAKPNINDKKIDYSVLKGVNFDIKSKAKQLIYKNDSYINATAETILKDGVLKVSNFGVAKDEASINMQFVLNSNNLPNIEGTYSIKALPVPALGGDVYLLESGQIDAEGTFKSSAVSAKDFVENLDSRGKFLYLRTALRGWDLDIIKFEFEQRKDTDGFENSILNNLKSGRSIFSSIYGKYDISKGLAVIDNAIWESPVANINMKFDFNFSDWLFNAAFNAIYLNASFSDVLKYSFSGSLANPEVKTDLSESIQRISHTESMLKAAQDKERKDVQLKLSNRVNKLKDDINDTLFTISKMSMDVVRFKPQSSVGSVQTIYESNVSVLKEVEEKLTNMLALLKNGDDEKLLMELEAEVTVEKSKLKFIPKQLEDNYIVDSKYIFDNIFNKIAWVYNVAKSNSAYYNGLIELYMKQIKFLEDTDEKVSAKKIKNLDKGIQAVQEQKNKIVLLHSRIRENYLSIIDAARISEIKENNDLAKQALDTILIYTEDMNNKIIRSIDDFRATLKISTRDYDEYMVFPPKDAKDIDINKPTIRLNNNAANAPKAKKSGASVSQGDDAKKKLMN